MVWTAETSCGKESDKIAHLALFYTRGRCLDVGCGMSKVWPSVIGVDSGKAFGPHTEANLIADIENLDMFRDGSMDGVYSSHTLEHIVDYKGVLKKWWTFIKPGGFLTLYLPHKNLYPNIGQPGSNPDHKHDFLPSDIIEAMREIATGGYMLLENEERAKGNEYSFFQVFQKRTDGEFVDACWQKTPGKKSVLLIRYGAIGDGLQTASVARAMKEEGWEVHVNTVPSTWDILREDPNIDAFWLQDKDQVPNPALNAYWKSLETEGRWDKIVNLCESVEGIALAMPGRIQFTWPPALRHKACDYNYLERMHETAEAPLKIGHRFYPTDEEMAWAKRERFRIFGSRPLIVWSLVGSSIHKIYPHVDIVAKWLEEKSQAGIAFVSDGGLGKQIQDGVLYSVERAGADMARFHGAAGEWNIRQALTMAQIADVVVGPETGVLNSVAFEPNRKVVFLSHSSVNNLTRDWINTASLESKACPKGPFPCHMLHYAWDHCHQDAKTKAAVCAADIRPEATFKAIMPALKNETVIVSAAAE